MNQSLKDISIIMFDLDGTLVNSMGYFTEIAAKIISKHYGCTPDESAKMYKDTSGEPFFMQLARLFPNNPSNAEAVDEFEETKRRGCSSQKFYEDVEKNLSSLKKAGYKLVLSSNNTQDNVEKMCEKYCHLFDAIFGFKPNFMKIKDHLHEVKKRYRVEANQILFVGDSVSDAQRAREHNVAFIARAGTNNESDFNSNGHKVAVIKSFDELSKLLRF